MRTAHVAAAAANTYGFAFVTLAIARPNFTGVWMADLEKSVLRGVVPHQLLMSIDHQEPKLVQRILNRVSPTVEHHATFAVEIDAEAMNSIGEFPARSRARWEADELLIETWVTLSGRELHFKDYWSLSGDGETLTMAHREDDLAGQVCVLHKATASDAASFPPC